MFAVIPSGWPRTAMAALGQKAKYSPRADVFRIPPIADMPGNLYESTPQAGSHQASYEALRARADCGSVPAMRASDRSSLTSGIFTVVLAGLTLGSVAAPPPAAAEIPAIASRQRAEKKTFTDSEITDGFLKTAFGAEFHLAGRVDRIRKYDVPVRVFAEGANRASRKTQLAKVVADIAMRVQHLDIAMAESSDDANVVVTLVRDRDLYRTITTFYGSERAREIKASLDPQCLSGFRKSDKFEIEHSDVILTVDNGDFIFLDCAYEELLQSLGPINDTSSVPWTMFNDNVSMGFFDIYDQYILNILYDPRIKAGMSVAEVKAVLPEVLTDVRLWVRKVNDLPE
jgi:Protein of unknown function (DUF2927)